MKDQRAGYDRRYIAGAVAMVLDQGYSFGSAAQELQIPEALLHTWVEDAIEQLSAATERAKRERRRERSQRRRNAARHGRPNGEASGNGERDAPPHHNRLDIFGHHIDADDHERQPRMPAHMDRTRKPDDSELWVPEDDKNAPPRTACCSATTRQTPSDRRRSRERGRDKTLDQTLRLEGDVVIKFRCEHCEQKLRSNDHLAGKVLECPGCGYNTSAPTHAKDPRVYMYVRQKLGELTMSD